MSATEIFDDPNVAEDVARCCDSWAACSEAMSHPMRAAALRELAVEIRKPPTPTTKEPSMEVVETAVVTEVMPPAAPWEALPEGQYAIVELMGHTTLVGRITEVERFGSKMMGIEPLFAGQLLPVVLQGGAAIYRLTMVSPEAAWKRQHKPEHMWSLPEPIQAIVPVALLPAPTPPAARAYDYGDDDRSDDDDDNRPF